MHDEDLDLMSLRILADILLGEIAASSLLSRHAISRAVFEQHISALSGLGVRFGTITSRGHEYWYCVNRQQVLSMGFPGELEGAATGSTEADLEAIAKS